MRPPLLVTDSRALGLATLVGGVLAMAVVGLGACEPDSGTPLLPSVCRPVLEDLLPSEGPTDGGTDVVLTGRFVVSELGERDVIVQVAGQDAEVLGLERAEGCAACDGCALAYQREFTEGSEGPLSCDGHPEAESTTTDEDGVEVAGCLEWACDRICRGITGWCDKQTGEWFDAAACTEQVTFRTPPAEGPGDAGVVLTSSRGSGIGLSFTYLGDDDDSSSADP